MRWLLALLLACPLFAADLVILDSGFTIAAQKVERIGTTLILHTESGRIEIDSARVTAIEPVPEPPSPPASVVPVIESAAPRPLTTKELVTEAALKHGLPPEFVHSVASTESAYKTNAVSVKGAIGVMQLMPGTARALDADPHDVHQNIEAGARLLRDLLVKYQNDPNPVYRALAAYNAGEGAVKKYNGVPPYRETTRYIDKVLERYWKQVNVAAPGTN